MTEDWVHGVGHSPVCQILLQIVVSSAWSSRRWSPCRRLWRLCRDAQLILPVLLPLHACESWILKAEFQRRIQAMEMRYYRMILHIVYKSHVTNEEVRSKIQQAIRPHKDLTIIKRRKLQCVVMSPIHQVWPKPSWKAQWKEEEDKADRWRGGKTTSGNGQAWSLPSPRG